MFESASGFNEPISRISASCYNSAAYTESSSLYVWGSGSDFKLGTKKTLEQEVPLQIDWQIEKESFMVENVYGE